MAASVMSVHLGSAFRCMGSITRLNLDTTPRILACYQVTQVQSTRGARRTCKAPRFHVKKNVDHVLNSEELTQSSKKFLDQVVEDKMTARLENSPLRSAPAERNKYTFNTIRCGVLAIKIGVIPQWTKDGERFTCTLLQVVDNHVVRYVPPEVYSAYSHYKLKYKYGSVVVGALSTDPLKHTKAYNNLFSEAGIPPKRKLTRFLVTPDAAVEPGTPLKATHFKVGDYVDAQAKTIGHGFQGVVKRWGMKGGPASHGTTKWHRRVGNIGGGRGKAALWKGRKMPGHMGMEWRKLMGLKIYRINTKYNVLYVKGQNIPGPIHCYVRLYDCRMRHRRADHVVSQPYMPTYYPGDIEPLPEEIFDDELFQFNEPTITFSEKEK